jgi:hypothetical protein
MDGDRLAHIEEEAAPDAPFRDELWLALQVPELLAYVRQLEAVADAARGSLWRLRDCGDANVWRPLADALGALDAAKPPPPGDRGRGER